MKKLFFISLFASLSFLFLPTEVTFAAKPVTAKCVTIQSGALEYSDGHFLENTKLTTGYDIFGYNYQARIFNGSYANAYLGRSDLPPYLGDSDAYLLSNPSAVNEWVWPYRDITLQMKWNDAWLSNVDCNTDGQLDRHYGFDSYKGSGAWLTNHATGTYEGSSWDLNGEYTINVEYLGIDYSEKLILSQSGTTITGTSLALLNGTSPWTIDEGLVSGNDVTFSGYFNSNPSMRVTFVGTISSSGLMSGTWSDEAPGTRTGTWESTLGTVNHEICPVSDFVKIVAVPSDAVKVSDIWFTSGGQEIGPDIWGEFAIIQEIGSDPCGEYGVIDYLSPLRKGLGNW